MNSNPVLNNPRTLTRAAYAAVAVAVISLVTALETATPQCHAAPKPPGCTATTPTSKPSASSTDRIRDAFDAIGKSVSAECNPAPVCAPSPLHGYATMTAWIAGVLAVLLIARLLWMKREQGPRGQDGQFEDRHYRDDRRYTPDPDPHPRDRRPDTTDPWR